MAKLSVEVKGLLEAKAKNQQVFNDLTGEPFQDAMRSAVSIVLRDARLLAPVDTGQLKSSITGDVRRVANGLSNTNVTQGVVGSNKKYAPYVELGTKAHFPPLKALEVWARRHGTSAFAVARGISIHGTKPRRFLQGAFEKNEAQVKQIIGDGVKTIVEVKK